MILLHLLYYNKINDIVEVFGKVGALEIRDSLINSPYIVTGKVPFTQTVLSKKNVEKLLGVRSDLINFWEFYNCYPIKVGSRVLRASGDSSQLAQKHEKKYLARVKTKEQHAKAIASVTAFVAAKKQANELQFLPQMETILNNSLWEQWEIMIQPAGKEEQEWNSEQI